MGLFGNLWDGVKSAGQWAIDHSANIAPVVKAVGNAASALLMDNSNTGFATAAVPESLANETGSQQLAKYPQTFAYVSHRLAAAAKEGVQANPEMASKTTIIEVGLVGLWTDPNGLSFDGSPSISMYQDLSAFMGTMNIPVSWTDSSGDVHDTVHEIGQILSSDSWVVTMNITWASVPIAASTDVQKRFTEVFTKQNSVLNLAVSNVTGTLQTVKVQTPADKTPAYAKAAVEAAATAALNDGSNNKNEPTMNTAQVCVTDSSWLPKGSNP
ncbi:hypothetical protein FAGAP_6432 [Fusarium agapanthi]|uniref:Uncharacterized protein n=1 Tax=Fusarium agapanthi TaxID=1803897 RepID=A0A9P5BB34_9HYPO|nr:hypothetical protein FAGAP_6432 [Fusarium agapanthi]